MRDRFVKIRMLLADDHPVLRQGLRLALERAGDIEVVAQAGNGIDAAAAAREHRPDVALLDLAMPLLNGIDAIRGVRGAWAPTRVLILSMHGSSEHVQRALDAGASGYVLKESAAEEVVEGVRAVYAGRRFLSPALERLMTETVSGGARASPLERLSARERQVLQLVVEGNSSADIGRIVHLSTSSVDTYRRRLMAKLGVRDLPALVKFALQHGITPPS